MNKKIPYIWPVILFILTLVISVLLNFHVPDKYKAIQIGIEGHTQKLDNFVFFQGWRVMFLFLVLCIFLTSRQNIALNLLSFAGMLLACGKIVDEFTDPYGYHKPEKIFNLTVIILSLFYFYYLRKTKKNE